MRETMKCGSLSRITSKRAARNAVTGWSPQGQGPEQDTKAHKSEARTPKRRNFGAGTARQRLQRAWRGRVHTLHGVLVLFELSSGVLGPVQGVTRLEGV